MTSTSQPENEPSTTTYNVLFVCTGNTCRSPMAEAVARREIAGRGWRHVLVRSAGIAAYPGSPATDTAIAAGAAVGLDLAAHRATVIDPTLIEWADVILTMSHSHIGIVEELGGSDKAALLGDFAAGEEGAGDPVPDPFGGSIEVYRDTLEELERLVGQALDRLSPILQP